MDTILHLLTTLGIPFAKYEHPAVFSCEESAEKCPQMDGAHTKQLLLRDKKKTMVLLAIVMHNKRVDTRALAKEFGVQSFSFASPELMMELLGVTPGSVTPLGLTHDKDRRIKVIVDEDAWNIGKFLFHPMINTATLGIGKEGFERFLKQTGHGYEVRRIPITEEADDEHDRIKK